MIYDWHKKQKNERSLGQVAADKMRAGMGSWAFVLSFVVVMAIWMLSGGFGIDKMPFILLNLALSTLAGLQGAILLIAAKRADQISAALAQHDYETNIKAKEEIEELRTLLKENTEITTQIHILQKELSEHLSRDKQSKI